MLLNEPVRSVLNEDFRLEHPWRTVMAVVIVVAGTVSAFLLLWLELA